MEHGTVGGVQKKDRKRFHLKRIRRGKKEAEPGSSSQGKAGSGGKAPLQVEITVSQEAAAAHDISASMDNLADVNRGDSKSVGAPLVSLLGLKRSSKITLNLRVLSNTSCKTLN